MLRIGIALKKLSLNCLCLNYVSIWDLIRIDVVIPSKDLEKQVRTKKADYITQKQRADEINYQLLPKSIAEEFKVWGPKLGRLWSTLEDGYCPG